MINLFKNCIDVIECDGGWLLPVRFTEKQFSTYSTEAFSTRAHSPASVVLAFKTKSKRISFEYKIGKRARDWALFDLKCDGVLVQSISVENDEGRVEFSLSGDAEKEYRIYLPHLVVLHIRNVESDLPLLPVADRGRLWLALGDSITQGMNALHPSSAYPSIIADYLGFDVLNLGVGGAVFNFENLDAVPENPDIVTFALGTNDWGVSPEIMRERVEKYIVTLLSLYSPKHIYAILPIWRSDADVINTSGMDFEGQRATIRGAVEKYPEIKIIDGYEIIGHLEKFYGEPVGRKVHPTDEGFLHMSLGIIKEFSKDGITV